MRIWSTVTVALTTAVGLIAPLPSLAQRNPFQPIARIDPSQPITLVLTNRSGSTLEAGLTTRRTVAREIQPEETVEVTLAELPAYLNISTPSRPPYSELSLAYRVRSQNNRVTITVDLKNDTQGDRIVDFHEQGGIYVY
ncbi:MAG: hypothetical protein OHK0012_14200 [Synechococcales cyanobacterium]